MAAVAQSTYSRGDLVDDVAASVSMSKKDTDAVIRAALDQIAKMAASGRRVELRGFAIIEVKDRAEKKGRNPATGESIVIPAHRQAVCRLKFPLD